MPKLFVAQIFFRFSLSRLLWKKSKNCVNRNTLLFALWQLRLQCNVFLRLMCAWVTNVVAVRCNVKAIQAIIIGFESSFDILVVDVNYSDVWLYACLSDWVLRALSKICPDRKSVEKLLLKILIIIGFLSTFYDSIEQSKNQLTCECVFTCFYSTVRKLVDVHSFSLRKLSGGNLNIFGVIRNDVTLETFQEFLEN